MSHFSKFLSLFLQTRVSAVFVFVSFASLLGIAGIPSLLKEIKVTNLFLASLIFLWALKFTLFWFVCLIDLWKWSVEPAFGGFRLPTRAVSGKHTVLVSHVHLLKSCLLLHGRTERRFQLVDVLCPQLLHVPIGEWRFDALHRLPLARCLLDHFDSHLSTREFFFCLSN